MKSIKSVWEFSNIYSSFGTILHLLGIPNVKHWPIISKGYIFLLLQLHCDYGREVAGISANVELFSNWLLKILLLLKSYVITMCFSGTTHVFVQAQVSSGCASSAGEV